MPLVIKGNELKRKSEEAKKDLDVLEKQQLDLEQKSKCLEF